MHAINFSGQVKPACFGPPWARVALSHKSISLSHLLRHALNGSCAKAVPTRTVSATANMQHRTQLILISLPPCGFDITIVRGIIPCRVLSQVPRRCGPAGSRRAERSHRSISPWRPWNESHHLLYRHHGPGWASQQPATVVTRPTCGELAARQRPERVGRKC